MNVIGIFDIISTVGFLAGFVIIIRIKNKRFPFPSKFFLCLSLLIYVFVGISNCLEHGNITDYFDGFEDYFELLYIPFFLFFLFSFEVYSEMDERKKAEEDLISTRDFLDNVIESSLDSIVITDNSGHVTRTNRSFQKLLGMPEKDITGKLMAELSPTEQGRYESTTGEPVEINDSFFLDTETMISKLTEEGKIFNWETYLVCGERKVISVEESIVYLYNETGKRTGAVAIIRDITERKQAERELKTSKEFLENVFNTSSDGILVTDDQGIIIRSNKAIEMMLQYHENELIGKHTIELAPRDEKHRKATEAMIEKLFSRGLVVNFELEWTRKGGGLLPTELNINLLKNPDGNQVGAVAAIRDITYHKQAQEEREKLFSELESKNAELERFTYTVSHDLKSPLITIKGFLGLLSQDVEQNSNTKLNSYISRITNAADKMQQLLDELLELSRIGRLEAKRERVSLKELTNEVLELLAGGIAEKKIAIKVSPDLPDVYGERPRLLEVMQNLIDNAIKHTGDHPEPHIEIGVRQDGNTTVCYVSDNGKGIDPRYHEKVFGLFDKLENESDGTGIGLAIVKRIVEVHGGRIWVESDGSTGRGATFCFTVPLTKEA